MYTLLIVFFLVSIIFSFLCSIWEAVLLSITPAFTERKVQEGGEVGETLQSFKANIDRPLAAILTLNTIAHTVGAIGVGAQATAIWGASIMATLVVPVVMTLAILLLSEIIPKTIGANYWRELATFTVKSLKWIILVLSPLVYVSQIITRVLKKDKGASVLSRADFTAMAELGAKQGVFDEGESGLLRSLLKFKDVRARDIMTPRTVMVAVNSATSMRDFHDAHPDLRFSRIPIYGDNADAVSGYFLKDEMLTRLVQQPNDNTPVADIGRSLITVKESFPIPELFDRFLAEREHIALVVDDEFGGTEGIVSMEDVIETLLGLEIVDELDHADDMQALARKNWERRAKLAGIIDESSHSNSD